MKKKNELAVFEEFRLKPEDFRDQPPKKKDLKKIPTGKKIQRVGLSK